jgi:NADPH-dependent 2,4-dienoyl-CoA reductase/sulfur reductase-like enzyme/rhodanese-related sulfurtransferase
MKVLIIGGVAAGATAAARARRLDETAEITVLERGPYVSYANCGLPYFISRDIEVRSKLLLQTPEGFERRYRVQVRVNTEALEIDRAGQRVRVRTTGAAEEWLAYDTLLLAQGGTPIRPPLPGATAPHVFTLWTVPDMDRLHTFLEEAKPATAVVVGGGFIGLEMAEALVARGVKTTVVELAPTVLGVLDREFGVQVQGELARHGVQALTGVGLKAIGERDVELADGRRVPGELVLLSVGVKPELGLARAAGLALGTSGAVLVDETLRTSDEHIWAAGDMVEVTHLVSKKHVRIPLAGPANRQGRIAASNMLGAPMKYRGALGTSVVKVFEATAAMTGLSERAARDAGLDVGVAVLHKDHHASYYPGGRELSLKLVYERPTHRLLGAEAFGHAGVDKRIDVLATALQGHLTLDDLAELDLAYAPPFSSANDPVNLAAFIGLNDCTGYSPLVSAAQAKAELAGATPPVVLDVRTKKEVEGGALAGSLHIPVDELRARLAEVPRGRRLLLHCRSGFRAHLALRVLKAAGFTDLANITGGWVSLELER